MPFPLAQIYPSRREGGAPSLTRMTTVLSRCRHVRGPDDHVCHVHGQRGCTAEKRDELQDMDAEFIDEALPSLTLARSAALARRSPNPALARPPRPSSLPPPPLTEPCLETRHRLHVLHLRQAAVHRLSSRSPTVSIHGSRATTGSPAGLAIGTGFRRTESHPLGASQWLQSSSPTPPSRSRAATFQDTIQIPAWPTQPLLSHAYSPTQS